MPTCQQVKEGLFHEASHTEYNGVTLAVKPRYRHETISTEYNSVTLAVKPRYWHETISSSHDQCYLECNCEGGSESSSPNPWFSSTCLWPWNLQSLIHKMNISCRIKRRTQTPRGRKGIPNKVVLTGLVAGAAQHHLVRNYHSPSWDMGFSYILRPQKHRTNYTWQCIHQQTVGILFIEHSH